MGILVYHSNWRFLKNFVCSFQHSHKILSRLARHYTNYSAPKDIVLKSGIKYSACNNLTLKLNFSTQNDSGENCKDKTESFLKLSKEHHESIKETTDPTIEDFTIVDDKETYDQIRSVDKRTSAEVVTDEKVDDILARYNIEEFYGVEPTIEQEEQQPKEETLPISLDRGVHGVFDVDEVVKVLNEENMLDVCAIKIPKEINYVDHMVIGTGRSTRQLIAVAEHMRWIWKRKRSPGDPRTIFIEGVKSHDWLAMDMGNIALHLFLKDTREMYDLEGLWTCGVEFDTAKDGDRYSIQITSQNASLEETKQKLIEQMQQTRYNIKEQNDGNKFTEFPGYANTKHSQFSDFPRYEESESLSASLNNCGEDLIKRKYMVKRDDLEESSMENKSGYHPEDEAQSSEKT